MDGITYAGIGLIVVQLIIIIYLFMRKPKLPPPVECPVQATGAFVTLGESSSLTLPTTKDKVCPPCPTFSTVSAK